VPKQASKRGRAHHAGSDVEDVERTESKAAPAGARPTWSGSLSFGLVTIPVELYSAIRPRQRRARMLDEEGAVLSRRFYCPTDGKELDDSEIVRGYELPNGKYALVDDEELEALEPKKSREIDLRLFTDRRKLDPVLFERAYLLIPASEGNKAYRLLTEVMHRTERAGIATFVMREREYIIAIVSDGRCLLGETLRFADELRPLDELDLPTAGKGPKPMSSRIERALATKRAKRIDAKKLVDPAHARLEKLIETKRRRGETIAARAAEPEPLAAESGGAEVIDLMQLLKSSLRNRAKPPTASKAKPTRAGSAKAKPTHKSRKAARH
jgi:DNA end-binding protein Ku